MSNMPANVRISAQFPFPAGVAGTTPIAITKANGIWSVALPLDALATQNPSGGSLTTDYVLVWDSLTGTYFKMPISNVPTGPPGPPGPIGPAGPAGGIADAPSDGVNYGRKNATWNNLDTIFGKTPGQIVGTPTNDTAAAGNVGEYISSTVNNPGVALTTGVAVNVTSISLTAGDWDVSCASYFVLGASTNITLAFNSISLTTATIDFTPGNYSSWNAVPGMVLGATSLGVLGGTRRISIAGTTTVFFVVVANFTVSTCGGYGIIRARRMR
jgi:hypothetical protein